MTSKGPQIGEDELAARRAVEAKEAAHRARRPLHVKFRDAEQHQGRRRDKRDDFVASAEFDRRRAMYAARYRRDGSPVLSVHPTKGKGHWKVNTAPVDCVRPREKRIVKRPTAEVPGAVLHCTHACGKWDCPACAEMMTRQWMARAGEEFRRNVRTWMITITMCPAEHARLGLRAVKQFGERHHRHPTADEQRRAVVRAFGEEVSGWYDRLYGDHNRSRDLSSYLAVCELHDSPRTSAAMRGKPHYHILLHEKQVGVLIKDDDCEFALQDGEHVFRVKNDARPKTLWPYGFTSMTLVRAEEGATYCCKYLAKGHVARLRCSLRYGAREEDIMPDSGWTG